MKRFEWLWHIRLHQKNYDWFLVGILLGTAPISIPLFQLLALLDPEAS